MSSTLRGVGNVHPPLKGDIVAYADASLNTPVESITEADFGDFLETHSGGPRQSSKAYHVWVRNESNRRQGVRLSSDNPNVTPLPYGDAGFSFAPGEVQDFDIKATYRGSGEGLVGFNFTLTGSLSHLLGI